jgi:hypothetical protein
MPLSLSEYLKIPDEDQHHYNLCIFPYSKPTKEHPLPTEEELNQLVGRCEVVRVPPGGTRTKS